jgi:hypothetical protein
MKAMKRQLVEWSFALLLLGGCSEPYSAFRGDTSQPRALSGGAAAVVTPVAAGMAAADYAQQPDEELRWGWNVVAEGELTRWRECTSATECTEHVSTKPSDTVLGLTTVGRAPSPRGGEEIDVVRIRLKRARSLARRP